MEKLKHSSKNISIQIKLQRLKDILESMESVLVAYSGGVDSTFLLKIASETLPKKVFAVVAISPTLPSVDRQNALKMIKKFRVRSSMLQSLEMQNPDFIKNDHDRCYWCKKGLFHSLKKIAAQKGLKHVIEGSNNDDISDYRPGLKALGELQIRSPLMEAEMTKSDIRELSLAMKLPTWNRPSSACLSSRIPYGTKINESVLKRIDAAEMVLRKIGFCQVRVRHHGDIARIEVDHTSIPLFFENKIRKKILSCFKKFGYLYVTLDLEGYSTGSMNKALLRNGQQ